MKGTLTPGNPTQIAARPRLNTRKVDWTNRFGLNSSTLSVGVVSPTSSFFAATSASLGSIFPIACIVLGDKVPISTLNIESAPSAIGIYGATSGMRKNSVMLGLAAIAGRLAAEYAIEEAMINAGRVMAVGIIKVGHLVHLYFFSSSSARNTSCSEIFIISKGLDVQKSRHIHSR